MLAVCTIISKNYLAYARTLAHSFHEQHPNGMCFVLLTDAVDEYFKPHEEPFTLIELSELKNIPDFESFAFKYNIVELNTAVKPYFIEHLFQHKAIDRVAYFDPDIFIYSPLDQLDMLLNDFDFLLTPHITRPIDEDGFMPDETLLLRVGTYNLGFIGLKNTLQTKEMLQWWQSRLYDKCVNAIELNYFTDQKWIDFVPAMHEKVHIIRNPGMNAAYWNLHYRNRLEEREGWYFINGVPLVFFHFSGFSPDKGGEISKYQTRHNFSTLAPNFKKLFANYRRTLILNGFERSRHFPYSYDFFSNGVRIHNVIRRLYWEDKKVRKKFPSPFSVAPTTATTFYRWLKAPVRAGTRITNFIAYLYRTRPDLRALYPDVSRDENSIIGWARAAFAKEYGIDDAFLKTLGGEIYTWQLKNFLAQRSAALKALIARIFVAIFGKRMLHKLLNIFFNSRYRHNNILMPAPFVKERRHQFGVNIIGYAKTESGVGETARNLARALASIGIPFSVYNIEAESYRACDISLTSFSDSFSHSINLFCVNADQIPHVIQTLPVNTSNYHNIGYMAWEVEDFPERFTTSFSYLDEVWTVSEFAANIIKRYATIPVYNMGHYVTPPERVPLIGKKHFGLPEDSFVFMYMFDGNSYTERKNPDALIEAYTKSALASTNSMLLLKTTNLSPNDQRSLEKKLHNFPHKIINEYLSRNEVYALLNCADCYVSPHRAEGFGYTIAEAMCLGKPVIATGYSGNMEYCTPDNTLLLDYTLVRRHRAIGPYEKGGVWAEPSVTDLTKKLEAIRFDPSLRLRLSTNARETIKKGYTIKAFSARLGAQLERIRQSGAREAL